jgi:phosphatidate cytidylyltransferase
MPTVVSQRVITAAVLVPLVIVGVLTLPSGIIALVFGVIALLGSLEWAALSGWHSPLGRAAYAGGIALVLSACYRLALAPDPGLLLLALFVAVFAWWVAASYFLCAYQRGGADLPNNALLTGGLGILVIVSAWAALVAIHARPQGGRYLVLLLLLLIWTADIAAYFAGRRWGRVRLADRLSPRKTWAGVWGALAASLLVAALSALSLRLGSPGTLEFMAIALVTVVFSIVGDLFESLLKRRAGVKDSGTLLPGHGGVLDRIDSLLAAAPIFALGTMLLEGSA